MRVCSLLFALLVPALALFADDFDTAVAAFQRGDSAAAEATLDQLLSQQSNDSKLWGLLGAVLDSEKKYPEADSAFRKALRLTPGSPALLNNYANHQLAAGDRNGARATYLKVLALDPNRANANLQLASLAVQSKSGVEALRYLDRLPASEAGRPEVLLLRVQALFLVKRAGEAEAVLSRLCNENCDPRVAFTSGLALAQAGKYADAERLFSRTLAAAPGDFDVLANLGLAAYRAGHLARAREALEAAHVQRPRDVDTLYNLAGVDVDLKQLPPALQLLAEASRLDPARADVALRLAQTASALGLYADARLSYEAYLKLRPGDESARRELDFMSAASQDPREGLAALQKFVLAHPNDATARYEVGLLEAKTDPADSAVQFRKALALEPGFAPARLGRGVLKLLQGDPAAALVDLEFAAGQYPDNPSVLDRLGEAYTALGRASDAVRTLEKASQIAPQDARILIHLSRALTKAGQTEEAHAVLAHFRTLDPQSGNVTPPPGLIALLTLPPEQQQGWYRDELQKRLAEHPDDPALNMRSVKLLVATGRIAEANAAAARLVQLGPPPALAAEAAHAMVAAGDYFGARALLEYAAAGGGTMEGQLDLATVLFHTAGPEQGLAQLERIPQGQRSAEYYVARAEIYEAQGKVEDAHADLRQALTLAPQKAQLYAEDSAFLLRHSHQDEAVQLMNRAGAALPDNAQILLLKAEVLYAAQRPKEAEEVLEKLQDRWPELGPNDAGIQQLAGELDFNNGDYKGAVNHLTQAIHLQPDYLQAHETLALAYSALSLNQEAAREEKEVERLRQSGVSAGPGIVSAIRRPNE